MSAIDEHICELLFEHDCVIVPSLGGFLASNVHAKLNPGQHTILPPRRKIAFNIYLRQNDGLLANHLVEYERVSYPEAIKRIEDYVQDCFKKLDLHRKVIVERVGTIYYDKEKHLLFEPFRHTQFRKDAYGLGSLQFRPIEREGSSARIEKQRKELMHPRPSVKAGRKFLGAKKSKYKILGLVAIAGTLLWFSFNLFLLQPGGGDLGSLNPFTQDSNPVEITQSVPTESKSDELSPQVQSTETIFVASTVPVSVPEVIEHPNEVEPTTKAIAETKKEIESSAASQYLGNFHVIAGAFKISGNADSYLRSLQNQGFSGSHIIRKGVLNYVSYSSFEKRSDALALLDSLRKQNVEGWIWRN